MFSKERHECIKHNVKEVCVCLLHFQNSAHGEKKFKEQEMKKIVAAALTLAMALVMIASVAAGGQQETKQEQMLQPDLVSEIQLSKSEHSEKCFCLTNPSA